MKQEKVYAKYFGYNETTGLFIEKIHLQIERETLEDYKLPLFKIQ